jgi:hypothetical protein
MIAQGAQIPGRSADPVCKGRAIQLDALPGIDLRLPVERQVIGILGDQHLRDQRLGGNAAFDDPGRRWSLHDRALARATAIARAPGDQHAEGGGHDIEAFGDILADLVERAAAAGAGLLLNIDDLLDPFEMGGQRSAVGLARAFARSLACLVHGKLGLRECGLNFLERQLELVRIELFRLAAKTMTHQRIDDRLQSLVLCPENLENIQLVGLFEDKRAQRINVIGKVRLEEHGRE